MYVSAFLRNIERLSTYHHVVFIVSNRDEKLEMLQKCVSMINQI